MTGAATVSKPRLDWVDAAKGISIMLVVMMYSAYSVGEDTGQIGILHHAIAWATPFRMPEFFLISGLFLANVIARPWARYADRRVVHYFYFYALWAVIHILFKTAVVAGEPMTALSYLAWAIVEPYGVLWFIYVLALVSAATKLLHTFRVPKWAGFALAAALQIAPVATGSYAVDQFAEFFVYFYGGYAFAPMIFKLVESATRDLTMALSVIGLWVVVNTILVFSPGYQYHPADFEMGLASLPGLRLVLAFAGSLALCVLAGLLARLPFMAWLSWLGSKSLVIYLSFALPMSAVRILLIRLGIVDDASVLSLIVFVAAMIAPLVLYAAIRVTGWGRFLFERPAWAHIPGTPGSRSSSKGAAAVPAE